MKTGWRPGNSPKAAPALRTYVRFSTPGDERERSAPRRGCARTTALAIWSIAKTVSCDCCEDPARDGAGLAGLFGFLALNAQARGRARPRGARRESRHRSGRRRRRCRRRCARARRRTSLERVALVLLERHVHLALERRGALVGHVVAVGVLAARLGLACRAPRASSSAISASRRAQLRLELSAQPRPCLPRPSSPTPSHLCDAPGRSPGAVVSSSDCTTATARPSRVAAGR